jgi:hypothetical protein
MHSAGPCSYAGRDVEFELALTGRGRALNGAKIVPSKTVRKPKHCLMLDERMPQRCAKVMVMERETRNRSF